MGDRQAAISFFNQGVAVHQNRDPNDQKMAGHLYHLFASSCMADPTWWNSYYQVGNNNSDLKLYFSAIAAWRRALECGDMSPLERSRTLSNLAWRLHTVGYTDEAFAAAFEAVKLNPTDTNAWINLSCLYQTVGDRRKSIEAARQAYAIRPDDETDYALAFALLFGRELEEGFLRFEARFPHRLKEYLQYPYPKWQGESGKTVLLAADQGMGDTLSFARFVPEVCKRSNWVHARIQAPLVQLFQHMFIGIKNIDFIPTAYPFPVADCWTTFVSLPAALGLDAQTIMNTPQPDPGQWSVPPTWKVPDRKLHIGIAWGGSPLNDIDPHRNLPLHLFFELHRVPGIQLYSLQCDQRQNEMHQLGGGAIIRDVVPYITNVVDTLAILRQIDMVISVESFLGHICALAGKECWIPYSWLGRDYRIGCDGTDSFWMPKTRVFRQKQDLDWRPVFKEMTEALREKVDGLDREDQKAST